MAKNVERLQAREAKELIRREKQLGARSVSVKPPHDLHLHLQYMTILPYSSR